MTLDDSYDIFNKDDFIKNLALLLKLQPNQIEIISIKQGSVIVEIKFVNITKNDLENIPNKLGKIMDNNNNYVKELSIQSNKEQLTQTNTNTRQYNKIRWDKPEIYLNSKPSKLWRLNKFIEIAQFKKGEMVWIYNSIENRIIDYGTTINEINEIPNNIINNFTKILDIPYGERINRIYTIQLNNKKIDLADEHLIHGAELAYFS